MAYKPVVSKYQYETSPRKVSPEYEPNRKQQATNKTQKIKVNKKVNKNTKNKAKLNTKGKATLYVVIAFIALFAVCYRNSQITESFNKKEELKKELGSIQKENEQLKVNIENSLNLKNIEQMAKEMLGMQKLDNSQKVYINLPKKDYIESASEEVVIEENLNIWQKIWKGLTNSIK
ncbi:MAG: hypothetical protein HFJ42_05280 [Clostridia bacterium]|nr:hypothetical protein [Clostridia bacterium]